MTETSFPMQLYVPKELLLVVNQIVVVIAKDLHPRCPHAVRPTGITLAQPTPRVPGDAQRSTLHSPQPVSPKLLTHSGSVGGA